MFPPKDFGPNVNFIPCTLHVSLFFLFLFDLKLQWRGKQPRNIVLYPGQLTLHCWKSKIIMRVFHAFAIGVTGTELGFMILANHLQWEATVLFPQNLLKGVGILALSLTFVSGIGFVSTFFQVPTWRSIHVSYTIGMALVCLIHIALIFLTFNYARHLHTMLMVVWANASGDYRSFVQNKVW